MHWVLFRIDSGRYALPLAEVERVVLAARVTPLPGAPAVILGALDIAGEVLPVFDLRHRFGLSLRSLQTTDHFLIARAAGRRVVLAIDAPAGVIEEAAHSAPDSACVTHGMQHIRGVIRGPDGLVLIHDLDGLLSAAEADRLDAAMAREVRHGA